MKRRIFLLMAFVMALMWGVLVNERGLLVGSLATAALIVAFVLVEIIKIYVVVPWVEAGDKKSEG